jgi:hypothetical protein
MEYIMMMEGQMILETGGKTYFLEQDDAIFSACLNRH